MSYRGLVEGLDLRAMGFSAIGPTDTPTRLPPRGAASRSTFNQAAVWSARRSTNVELMWLTGRLAPDIKIIAGFRNYSGRDP